MVESIEKKEPKKEYFSPQMEVLAFDVQGALLQEVSSIDVTCDPGECGD